MKTTTGGVTNTYEVRLFPFQKEVIDSKAKFRTLVAGRRVGKSYLAGGCCS